MEWANPHADSLDPLAAAGNLRPVRFKSPEPWLMKLAPWLPWRDDPADPTRQTKLLDYAPFAAIMWSFFLEIGSTYDSCPNLHPFRQNMAPVYNHVLHPGQCSEVLKIFEASGFTHDGSSFVSLSMAIQAYATPKVPRVLLKRHETSAEG